ncbi:MAG: hypothetical protein DHS20C17_26550 [Cyclobacteriaceae bacterium]|nr:MAG: hypothetical protein DHS20C17_26550 [Cyclobacteriaceae bacterium]
MMLKHELVHIQQGHSYDILLIELIKIGFWFNPVIWHLSKELRLVHEHLADAQVTAYMEPGVYIKYLAKQTLGQSTSFSGHHFNQNQTLKRIIMIQTNKKPTSIWKFGIAGLLLTGMIIFISCNQHGAMDDLKDPLETSEIQVEVDQMPAPSQGMEVFYQDIAKHLKYPSQARKMGIEGKVFLEFVVQANGDVTDIIVLKGIGAGCDQAAKEALAQSGSWNPGIKNRNPVAVKIQLPVVFKLNHDNIKSQG